MPDSNKIIHWVMVVHMSLMQFIQRKSIQNWWRFSGSVPTFWIWRWKQYKHAIYMSSMQLKNYKHLTKLHPSQVHHISSRGMKLATMCYLSAGPHWLVQHSSICVWQTWGIRYWYHHILSAVSRSPLSLFLIQHSCLLWMGHSSKRRGRAHQDIIFTSCFFLVFDNP